ncbi:MAG: Lrp/AsnC family transcriptional regulator [Pseudomonadota bacterium]
MLIDDDTDRALLAALRRNARASVTELSGALGVSRATVKTRLDQLIARGRIQRFTIETDTDIAGNIRAITLVELQGKMSRQVIRSLHGIPEVSGIHSTNGAWDLVVEITADTLQSFDRVLRDIREVPGVLNSESNILLARV